MQWEVSASPPTMQDDALYAHPKDEAYSSFLCTTSNLHIGGCGAQCEPSNSARADDVAVLLRKISVRCRANQHTKSTIGQILWSASANAADVTDHNTHYSVT